MATESGGDEAATRPAVPGMRPAIRRRRRLVTNEKAATGGVMYADEGAYIIDVRHVEEMMGTTREAVDGDRVRRGRDGDETGDKTADDERDGGDWWGNYTDKRELEFDEGELAALEGQRLVAKFICGIY